MSDDQIVSQMNTYNFNNADTNKIQVDTEEMVLKDDLRDMKEQLKVADHELTSLKNLQQEIVSAAIKEDASLENPLNEIIEEANIKKRGFMKPKGSGLVGEENKVYYFT